jgi:membrane-bound serine protease (ClpP class)
MTVAFVLILIGILLLLVEAFLPTGAALVLALAAMLVGVLLIFIASPEEGGGPVTGFLTLATLGVLLPILAAGFFYLWPHTRMGRRFFLEEAAHDEVGLPVEEHAALEQYLDQVGQTLTPHSPSGVTLINGSRVDTTTAGIYLEAGNWVRVVDVRAGQVTIRPLTEGEQPGLPNDLLG